MSWSSPAVYASAVRRPHNRANSDAVIAQANVCRQQGQQKVRPNCEGGILGSGGRQRDLSRTIQAQSHGRPKHIPHIAGMGLVGGVGPPDQDTGEDRIRGNAACNGGEVAVFVAHQ